MKVIFIVFLKKPSKPTKHPIQSILDYSLPWGGLILGGGESEREGGGGREGGKGGVRDQRLLGWGIFRFFYFILFFSNKKETEENTLDTSLSQLPQHITLPHSTTSTESLGSLCVNFSTIQITIIIKPLHHIMRRQRLESRGFMSSTLNSGIGVGVIVLDVSDGGSVDKPRSPFLLDGGVQSSQGLSGNGSRD